MKALVDEYGTRAEAAAAFNTWERQQRALILQYESAVATHRAQQDFTERNALTGTEHLEPGTAACDDVCQHAIDAGEVPLGMLPRPWPAHPRCPHYLQMTLMLPVDTDLWFGGSA